MTQQLVVPPLNTEEFLMHYGVPGMKWGKRKASGEKSDRQIARAEKKAEKVAFKGRRLEARAEIYKTAKNQMWGTKKRAAVTIASAVLLSPAVTSARVGYELSKAAGYSKAQAVATGLLGGAQGGVTVAEIASYRKARTGSFQ